MDHQRASLQLSSMRQDIYGKTFNMYDWLGFQSVKQHFDTLIMEWFDKKKLAPATYNRYKICVHNFYIPYFKSIPVSEIREDNLEKFRSQLLGTNTTKNLVMGILHGFFSYLHRNKVIKSIPIFPKRLPDDSEPKYAIDYESQQVVLERFPSKYRDMIEVGMELGLRTSEICTLKFKDINFNQKTITIQRTYSGSIIKESTKTNAKGILPLSDRAFSILSRLSKDKFPEMYIWKMTPTALQNAWRKYSGLDITLYEAIRHSFCTQIVETGVNVLQAKQLMRHKNIGSTEKYFHANSNNLRNILEMRKNIVEMKKRKEK